MIQISNYWALFLLMLIAFTFYLSQKSLAELSSFRKWSAFAIRSLIILLFVLALAGTSIVWKSNRVCAIFVLDVSNSIPQNEIQKGLSFINKSIENLKNDDLAGVISFAEKANIELAPKTKPNISKIKLDIRKDYTNIDSAIKTAVDLFPQGYQKRIILISDGNENVDNVLNSVDILNSQDIEIHTVPLSTRVEGKDEVWVENLIAPSQVNNNQIFEIKAVIGSNTDAKLKVMLFRDGQFLDHQEITIKKSDNKKIVIFKQIIESERDYTYKVLVEPNIDTISENNYAQVFVSSAKRRKILYVNGNLEARYLPQFLQKSSLDILVIEDMSKFPPSITELKDYGAVIFDNISAYSLSERQMRMLETYVHDVGGGFLMIGGENSFGSGGYHKTPIEKMLPVKMIPDEKKRSVSIMLLIDKSGSMNALSGNQSKIDLAKSASISVVDMLTNKDKIGIIAFDARADEIVRLNKVQSRDQIVDSILGIKARGGTNLYPAIKTAYLALKDSDSQIKHIIILSDGRSLQMEESLNLIKQITKDSITISSVVISDEADKEFMRNIAQIGSGRYYETDDAGNLPKLFIKEAFIASKLIMEGDFQPTISSNSEILKGTSPIPKLRGYIGTSIKEGAELILKSPDDDPILATWQYGLGRTLAFTSDSQPKWALEWLKWDNYGKLWSQAVNWCISNMRGEFEVTSFIKGSKGYITVDAVSASGQMRNFLNFSATIVKPNLTVETVELRQYGSGRYEAEFDADQKGVYILSIAEMDNEMPIATKRMGLTVSYSTEYTDLSSNNKLLENLASATGGKYLPKIEDIVGRKSKSVKKIQEIRRWLLILVIPLFFLDVAVRRLTLSKDQLYEFAKKTLYKTQEQTAGNKNFIYLKSRKEHIIDVKTIKKVEIISDLPTRKIQIIAKDESYTSRLLSAKKRASNNR